VIEYYHKKYRYFLVDEFQDTNFVQYLLTKLLAESSKNITVVGDFSQSIYSWRGADITNLKKFETDFKGTKTFYLEENYRSSQKILDFAFNIISKNSTHPILHLFTGNKPGEDIAFYQAGNEQEEAIYVAEEITRLISVNQEIEPPNFAILYRTNAQSRVLEEVLLRYGMPYILVGGTRFYERREVKDVLCYLRLIINPGDEGAEGDAGEDGADGGQGGGTAVIDTGNAASVANLLNMVNLNIVDSEGWVNFMNLFGSFSLENFLNFFSSILI